MGSFFGTRVGARGRGEVTSRHGGATTARPSSSRRRRGNEWSVSRSEAVLNRRVPRTRGTMAGSWGRCQAAGTRDSEFSLSKGSGAFGTVRLVTTNRRRTLPAPSPSRPGLAGVRPAQDPSRASNPGYCRRVSGEYHCGRAVATAAVGASPLSAGRCRPLPAPRRAQGETRPASLVLPVRPIRRAVHRGPPSGDTAHRADQEARRPSPRPRTARREPRAGASGGTNMRRGSRAASCARG